MHLEDLTKTRLSQIISLGNLPVNILTEMLNVMLVVELNKMPHVSRMLLMK